MSKFSNSRGAQRQKLKCRSKIAKNLWNLVILTYFFVLNTNLASILEYFLSYLFRNPFFCQFQRKNAFFGYSESTVVPWQKVSIKPNKNCSRYTVYKNLAAIQSSQIVKNRPKMGQISPKRHFFQKYQSYSEFFSQSHSIQSEIGQIYALRALNADTRVIKGQKQAKNRPKIGYIGQNLHFHQTDHCYSNFFGQSH